MILAIPSVEYRPQALMALRLPAAAAWLRAAAAQGSEQLAAVAVQDHGA